MRTGSELLTDIFETYGINHIFGNPGTTEIPFIESVMDSNLEYIVSLHEDIAVGMSSGYSTRARYLYNEGEISNPISVVNLHSTPGLSHGLANTYSAMFSSSPILVTTGSQNSTHEERNPPLSGDRKSIVQSVVKSTYKINSVNEIPVKIRRACRDALTQPMGPVYIDIPMDVQEQKTDLEPLNLGSIPTVGDCDKDKIDEIVSHLYDSNKTLITVGDKVAREGSDTINQVKELANVLDAPVIGEVIMSEPSYPTNDKKWVGSLMLDEQSSDFDPDLIVEIGCSTNVPLLERNLDENSTPIINISNDINGFNYSDNHLVSAYGNIGRTAQIISERIDNNKINNNYNIQKLRNKRKNRFKSGDDSYVAYDLVEDINNSIDDDTIVYDEGVTAGFVLRNFLNYSNYGFVGLKSGSLGYGYPASIGVGIFEEYYNTGKQVLTFIGDGAYQYYPQTAYSLLKYVDESVKVLVVDNDGYEILRQKYDDSEVMSFNRSIDVRDNARSYGLDVTEVDNNDIRGSINRLLNKDEPSLMRVQID